MSWQPIGTAPQDGTSIQVIGFSENAKIPVTVFYADGPYEPGWYLDDGENCFVQTIAGRASRIYQPTHWQPLAEAP